MPRRKVGSILCIIREYAELILLCIAGVTFVRILLAPNVLDISILFMVMLLLAALVC
ncbi:MAG: hypothetical protein ACM3ZQ_00510 [Bacillota bacterium]